MPHLSVFLFRRNREAIPHSTHDNPIVNAAIKNRIEYLTTKAVSLYSVQICYILLFEGFRYHTSILKSLRHLTTRPRKTLHELQALLSLSWRKQRLNTLHPRSSPTHALC
jgi:hypothetical protein